jgi:hypothetical protein
LVCQHVAARRTEDQATRHKIGLLPDGPETEEFIRRHEEAN